MVQAMQGNNSQMNLTGQLASRTSDFAALKKKRSKEVAMLNKNLISMKHDNTKLKILQTRLTIYSLCILTICNISYFTFWF